MSESPLAEGRITKAYKEPHSSDALGDGRGERVRATGYLTVVPYRPARRSFGSWLCDNTT